MTFALLVCLWPVLFIAGLVVQHHYLARRGR